MLRVQCRQAAQPILSSSYGAGQYGRIRQTLRYAVLSAYGFAAVLITVSMCFPGQIIGALMDATPEVLEIAPRIVRLYALSFIFLLLNVFSTYYFQSIMKPGATFGISVARGVIISGCLILFLPLLMG